MKSLGTPSVTPFGAPKNVISLPFGSVRSIAAFTETSTVVPGGRFFASLSGINVFVPGSFTFASSLPGTGFAFTSPGGVTGGGGGSGGGGGGGGGAGGGVVGACVTVTVKLFEAVLPELSFAVQFTFVLPTTKVEPEAGSQLTD